MGNAANYSGLGLDLLGAGRSSSMTQMGDSVVCSSSCSLNLATTAVVLSARTASRYTAMSINSSSLSASAGTEDSFAISSSLNGLQKPSLHSNSVSPDC